MISSRLRELREEDADEVAALFVSTFGEARKLDAEEVRSWLHNTEFEPGWLRVLAEEGVIVGYGDIWPKGDTLELDVVAPGRWDAFFDWAEREAGERDLSWVRIQVPHGHELADVAAARGYETWRHSLVMQIDLDDPPAATALPEGIEVRTYGDPDEVDLIAALNEAFSDDPFWLQISPSNFREFYLRSRGFDPTLWLLAFAGDELAGFSLTYPEHGTDAELGWVGTLGVRRPWRRRGLGEALLRLSFAVLYERGRRRIGLGVDAQNLTGALRLYERAGMRAVRRSDSFRKKL